MNLLKKSFTCIMLITLIASSNILQAAQTDTWMNYLTNLGNYFAANISKHKELVIGGAVVASVAAAYYLLTQNYSQQRSPESILKKIESHEKDWLEKNKNNFLVSKSSIHEKKQNIGDHTESITIKDVPYTYTASMHIDLNNWMLVDTITFKGKQATAQTTVRTTANISYEILNTAAMRWIIDQYKQLINDAKNLDYDRFFAKYVLAAPIGHTQVYLYNTSQQFPDGVGGGIEKPTMASLAFYRMDKKVNFLLTIWKAVREKKDTKNIVKEALPRIRFNLYPDTTVHLHYIGNMNTLIDAIWPEVIKNY